MSLQMIAAFIIVGIATIVVADHHHAGAAHVDHGDHSGQKEWTGKAWLGKWVSTERSENWDAFVAALGLPLAQFGGNHKTIHKLWKEGDHYHHKIIIKDKNYTKEVEFHLGEEGSSSHHGVDVKFKYTEEGDNKLVNVVSVPSKNKVIHDIYEVKGDELEKTYKIGEVQAKRWYKKQAAEPYSA